jgi:Na+(H+)/acetate symporter ActP
MSKELIISIILGVLLMGCVLLGAIQSSLLSNQFFLLFGLATILGQVVMAHLAFNQYKNLSNQTTKESTENEQGREERGDEQGNDGFDD